MLAYPWVSGFAAPSVDNLTMLNIGAIVAPKLLNSSHSYDLLGGGAEEKMLTGMKRYRMLHAHELWFAACCKYNA